MKQFIIEIVISFFSIAVCFFIIFGFIFNKENRKSPGGIIFGIAVSDFFLSIYWMIFGIYQRNNSSEPIDQDFFCQSMAFMVMGSATMQFLYNCAYILLLMQQQLFNIKVFKLDMSQQIRRNYQLKYMLAVLLSQFWFLLFCKLISNQVQMASGILNDIKQNHRVCSILIQNSFVYFGCGLLIIYICLSTYCLVYFKRNVPNNMNIFKQKLYTRYLFYFVCTAISWILIYGVNVFQFFSQKQNYGVPQWSLNLGEIMQMIMPIFLTIIRYSEQNIFGGIKDCFKKFRWFQQTNQKVQNESLLDNLVVNNFNHLKEQLKFLQIETLLFNMQLYYKSYSGINEAEQIVYKIKNYSDLSIKQGQKMHVWLPEFTQKLLAYDDFKISSESFDLDKNQSQINQLTGIDGGKSGQFFFITHDSKLILKTINNEELTTLNWMLPKFCNYVTNQNQFSKIAKIYGIFQFDFGQEPIMVIIMQNILQTPRIYADRVYDLKGSDFQREVLINSEKDPQKFTLKDTDFKKIERKVHVVSEQAQKLKEILMQDSEFLRECKLIDYSLLLVKINWNLYRKDLLQNSKNINQNLEEDNKFPQNYFEFESINEEQFFYQLAIIDYLQEYTVAKVAEQKYKYFVNFNSESTVQAPDQYCARFQQKVIYNAFQ